ncbi:MAG: hypothetical protein ACE5OW_07125 [Candidatus Bathyarchaeia archaeon]
MGPTQIQGAKDAALRPVEEEVDQLIAALPKKRSVFVQTIKETGARPGEIKNRLRWTT